MGENPHRVEKLAAEKFQPHNALLGIVGQILLEQKEIVRQPQGGIGGEQRFNRVERVDHLNACAASALIGLENGRPTDLCCVSAECIDIVECDRLGAVDVEGLQERSLCALTELERKDVGAVQDSSAAELERPHVGERQWD